MSRISVFRILQGAGWFVVLLLLARPAGISPASAQPQPVASSVYAEPVEVLTEIRAPDPAPTPAPSPRATTTPAPTASPQPTPTPAPTVAATPQPAPEPPATAAPTPPPSPQPSPPPAPPPPQQSGNDPEAAIISLTNELRAQHGLPPLAVNSALATAAQTYAQTMAASDWFAHEGPDGSTPANRAESAGYTGWAYMAENLYRGSGGSTADSIVQMWIASPAHLSALLSDAATEIGVGCEVSGDIRWCVQEFGAR